MRRACSIAIWLLLTAAVCTALRADTPDGYTRHLWQAPDGLPEQTVQAFAQTPDGYLWIGTTGGLLQFDGAHFTLFDRQNTPALRESSVFCLMVARDGALWIGTEGGGLVRYQNGHFSSWTTHDSLSNDFVRTLAQDAHGVIWVGTDNGLLHVEGSTAATERLVRDDNTSAIPALAVHAIYPDREGNLWVGGSRLLRLTGKTASEFVLRGEASQNRVKSIVQTHDGAIWVGTVSGLNRMLPGQPSFERVAGVSGTVRILRQTSDGVLWIGTIGQGAFEYSAGNLIQINAPNMLPSNTVLNFFEDGEKNLWIGTQTGMMRLTRTPVSIVPLPKANDSDFGTIYQDRDGSFWIGSTLLFHMAGGSVTPQPLPGLNGIHVRNVLRDRSGVLWAGTDGGGVFRLAPNHVTRFTTQDGLSNNFVRVMTQDRDGSMWVATDEGINHIVADSMAGIAGNDAKFRIVPYQMRNGLAYFSTRSLLEDRAGDLWIGTDRGLSHMHKGSFVSDAATLELAQMKVWAIHEDVDGGLWFGTRNNGLFRLRDGRMAHYSAEDGLAGNAIYQIVEDAAGHFWMSGPNGISLANRHELDAQADAPLRHFALTFYSISEMGSNTEIYGGTQPSGCITTAGDVWFPSNRGPIHILPLQKSLLPPPPLRIQDILTDGRLAPISDPIVLQPGTSRLEFAFTPIRLSSQKGLRFHYQLEGFDHDWSTTTSARTADYTNLPPGRYRFRVQTFDVGNPGAATEAALDVVQLPHFYRTWWFITSSILFAGLVIFAAYQYRVRQVRSRFEAVLEERSRLAREMHDTVIQGCTGVSALIEALSMENSGKADSTGLLDFARLQLRATINEAREAIWNLRQSDDDTGSIGERIKKMTVQVSTEFNIPVAFTLTGTPFGLSHPIAHDLLMVAREAVFNAVLHGAPAHVDVALDYTHSDLTLAVQDDGCGFDAEQMERQRGHHFGLRGMRERVVRCGGVFNLATAVGQGVRVDVRLPRNR